MSSLHVAVSRMETLFRKLTWQKAHLTTQQLPCQAATTRQTLTTPGAFASQSSRPSISKAAASIKVEKVLHSSAINTFFLGCKSPSVEPTTDPEKNDTLLEQKASRFRTKRLKTKYTATRPFSDWQFPRQLNSLWLNAQNSDAVSVPALRTQSSFKCQESRPRWWPLQRSTNVDCCTPVTRHPKKASPRLHWTTSPRFHPRRHMWRLGHPWKPIETDGKHAKCNVKQGPRQQNHSKHLETVSSQARLDQNRTTHWRWMLHGPCLPMSQNTGQQPLSC